MEGAVGVWDVVDGDDDVWASTGRAIAAKTSVETNTLETLIFSFVLRNQLGTTPGKPDNVPRLPC